MEVFVWTIIWCVISYVYAKGVKEKCPGIDVNPINYVIGAILIGAIFCIPYCWFKKRNYLKYNSNK